ncbi:MAG: hypothetical protein E3K32_09280 [wastewater metagenome]|nr:hypothetical protein [Candidatus Loosdrechtia aerotolerans]
MKRGNMLSLAPMSLLLILFSVQSLMAKQRDTGEPLPGEVIQKVRKFQIPFIANKGQIDERIGFYTSIPGGTVFITKDSYGNCMVMDQNGNVYIGSWTESLDFPTTANASDASYNDGYDVFISKFDNNLCSTSLPPTAITGSATDITTTSVTLHGTVNARGLDTVAWFEYGTEKGRDAKTSPEQTVIGSSDTGVNITIRELSGGLIYYYRLVARNEAGITYGEQATFFSCVDTYEPNNNFDTAYGPIYSGSSI